MSCKVVDTNVVLVANGQHGDVSLACKAACALELQAIMQNGKLALDNGFLILGEYLNKTTPKKGGRPGDAFVKWAVNTKGNVARIELVALSEHTTRGFNSFPDHPGLTTFDPPDRKFVAVAALKAHGVTVEFLCPDDIKRFQANKSG